MWFDLERRGLKILPHDFFGQCKRVLSLDCPMVIYCDPELAPIVRSHRHNAHTQVLAVELEQTPAFFNWGRVADRCKLPEEYYRSTWHYQVMCYNKAMFLASVARRNPFCSSYFAYVDIVKDGVGGIEIAATVPDDLRMHFHCRRYLEEMQNYPNDWYKWTWARIAGGYFGGCMESVIEFRDKMVSTAFHVVSHGHVAVDEDLYGYIVGKDMNQYHLSFGDYGSVFENRDSQETDLEHVAGALNEALQNGADQTSHRIISRMLDS
jgi:hypothetical protein